MSIGIPVLLFPLTFWAQLKLGYEVSLFPLYMLPIAALSWRFGGAGAFFSVALATGLWYWGNILSGYDYSYTWTRYYNAGVRALLFAAVGIFIILFKRVIQQHRIRMEAMRALLNVCHGCGSVQGSMGEWIPFDQLSVTRARPLCECPECTKAAQGTGSRAPYAKPETGKLKPEGARNAEAGTEKTEGGNLKNEERRRSEGRRVEDGAPPAQPWQPGDPERRQHIRREEDR